MINHIIGRQDRVRLAVLAVITLLSLVLSTPVYPDARRPNTRTGSDHPSMVFACWAHAGTEERDALILARSIREFAGPYSGCPIWILIPEAETPRIAPATRTTLDRLDARLISFYASREQLDFPYADKVIAAAHAEKLAAGKADILVWMDPDTILLNAPHAFNLPDRSKLGWRPVFLAGIGSPWAHPPDDFWSSLFQDCQVDPDHLFPMQAAVEGTRLRPYFNAGLLVVRPESELLRTWKNQFLGLYRTAAYRAYYRDRRYAIFFHQALLSAIILARLEPAELQLLPDSVNYSLFNHDKYPADHRPEMINQLISVRTEWFFDNRQWTTKLPAAEPLKSWIIRQVTAFE